MKRYIVAAFAVLMILSLFVLSAGASESVSGIVEGFESESTSERIFEGSSAADGTVEETVTQTPETVTEAPAVEDSAEESAGIDADVLIDAVSGAQSKAEAVIKIAELFGISISDAEELLDGFVAFGDEHFEESDMWLTIRSDIVTHPDKWTIIAIAALGFVALMVFLIRSVIKNTLTQTNTKLKLADIDDHQLASDKKLSVLDADNKEIKELVGGVKAMLEGESEELKRENEELKALLETVRGLIEGESAAVDSLKANSETSLKVTEESALQILQLLNIAMDRKVPIATKEARKLWYDSAVHKVKEKAGLLDSSSEKELENMKKNGKSNKEAGESGE